MPGLPSIRLCHRLLVRPCSAPHGLRQMGRTVYPAPRFREPRRLLGCNRFRRRFVKRLGHRRQKCRRLGSKPLAGPAQLGSLLLIQPCLEFVWTHGRPRNLSVHDCINEVVVSSQGGLIDGDDCIIKGPNRSSHGIEDDDAPPRSHDPSCRLGVYRHAVFVVRVDDRAVACGDGGAGESQQPVLGA